MARQKFYNTKIRSSLTTTTTVLNCIAACNATQHNTTQHNCSGQSPPMMMMKLMMGHGSRSSPVKQPASKQGYIGYHTIVE